MTDLKTVEKKSEQEMPASQALPSVDTGEKKDVDPNAPKMTEGGVVKDSKSGSSLAASAVTGTVIGKPNQPTISPKAPDLPKTNAAMPEKKKPLAKNFTEIKGEILQGDSFRLTLIRDGEQNIVIPIEMETTKDIYTLDNVFRIVNKMLSASREELEENFATFLG